MDSSYWEEPVARAHAARVAGWSYSRDARPAPPIEVLPESALSLLFSSPAGGACEGAVFGVATRAFQVQEAEAREQIQVHLAPGAAARLVGASARALVDRSVALDSIFGGEGRRLLDRLSGLPLLRRRPAIEAFLSARLGSTAASSGSELVVLAAGRLARSGGQLPIATLCDELGVGRRRLERAFRDEVGVSPKVWARIRRFRHAHEGVEGGAGLADVAAATGYSDQAHLGREYRAFTGRPPRRG